VAAPAGKDLALEGDLPGRLVLIIDDNQDC
jgi:hypothetical protein